LGFDFRIFSGLKGQNSLAQGSALGIKQNHKIALKGQD